MNNDGRQQPLGDKILSLDLSRRKLLKNAFALGISAPAIGGLLAACDDAEDDAASDSDEDDAASDSDDDDAASEEADDEEPDEAEDDSEEESEGSGPQYGGTLEILEPNDFVNMWPAFTTGPTALNCYDTIVEFSYDEEDESWGPSPGLAESWDIEDDGAGVTFHLREGVEFHDGTPFDAEALRWNIDQMRNHPQSIARTVIPNVDEDNPAEVVDELTCRMNLVAPDGAMLLNLSKIRSDTGIGSPTAFENIDREEEGDSIIIREAVGTGPFVFEEWVTGSHITLTRNENYWKSDDDGNQMPYLDGVRHRWVSDDSVRLLEMRSGEGDATEFIRGRDVSTVEDDENLQYVEEPEAGGIIHRFFFNAVSGPFADDPNLRKAVQYAIDREAMARTVGGEIGVPATLDVAQGAVGYDERVPYYSFDLDKAREHREMSSAPSGLEFRMVVIAREVDEQQSQMVQQFLQEIDLVVNIELVERAAWGDQVRRNSDFEMATQRTDLRTDPAPLWELTWAPEGAAVYARPDEPEIWEMIQESKQLMDDEARHEAYVELQSMMYEAAWWGNFWIQPQNFALNRRVRNFPLLWGAEDYAARQLWVDNS